MSLIRLGVIGLVDSNRKDGNTNTLVERILEGATV